MAYLSAYIEVDPNADDWRIRQIIPIDEANLA
jgi:hypothetical protein